MSISLGLLFVAIISYLLVQQNSDDKLGEIDLFPDSELSEKSSEEPQIREAEVAGQFYPADKEELSNKIESYLENTSKVEANGKPRVLFVPHAGLSYSGQTAAWGFSQLQGHDYSHVVILSANHQLPNSKAAVYSKGIWQTPLGDTEIDESFASNLIDNEANIIPNTELFTGDHTIEVELVFLQSILNNFKIVPVILGQVNDATIETLAGKLSYLMDEKTLLLVSTDLSHYPTWEDAGKVDENTIQAILSGREGSYIDGVSKINISDYQNLQTLACGDKAIRVALKTAELLGVNDLRKIAYSNSGDVTGDKTKVVGYAAIAGYKDFLPESQLDEQTKEEALTIARNTLETYLTTKKVPLLYPNNRYLYKPLGVFVTLNKVHNLRGCIGRFEPADPLYEVIQDTAIDAALHDSRFDPVQPSELEDIEIEISIMTPKVIEDSWQDIELGRHGVVIQKGSKSGTFLPQVATDTGWSKEEFLSQLCSQKAGLPKDCYKDPSVDIYTFEAQVFSE